MQFCFVRRRNGRKRWPLRQWGWVQISQEKRHLKSEMGQRAIRTQTRLRLTSTCLARSAKSQTKKWSSTPWCTTFPCSQALSLHPWLPLWTKTITSWLWSCLWTTPYWSTKLSKRRWTRFPKYRSTTSPSPMCQTGYLWMPTPRPQWVLSAWPWSPLLCS